MSQHDIHICMVSGQPLPNLIPALSGETRPRMVILLVSPDMKERGELLGENFEKLGCKVARVEIDPYRIDKIRATLLEVAVQYEATDLVLNATAGTKVMAMGAYDVFRELGKPAFYVDTDNNQLISLLPEGGVHPLGDVVKVKTYLSAYGYDIKDKGDCQIRVERQQLCEHLVGHAARYANALRVLNACAAAAEKKDPPWAKLEDRHQGFSELRELLDLFAEAQLIHQSHGKLYFSDESARRFAGGGWLEDYVVKCVNRLKGKNIVHDHLNNVVVETRAGVRNEIDLAFTARNRLHLIECKSGRLSEKEGKENRADGVAYKLDNLRDLMGGTYGKAMLVSFQKLEPIDRSRCAENRIEVVESAELPRLEEIIEKWIEGRRGPRRKMAKNL
ncbi:Card1-like endonuclease domain-containing protein [Geoalkalibacter sp.]|uniref:Card1-like endonuclease domain-containing protein n=1 Tax=Geoalkalibacter sp. TaxID=3041440 RepID=UPI00272E1D00|nr:DUF1887 family CARF protein [Geoalkalibacter sp.]